MFFSTSVELETDNVCLSVCVFVTKLWGTRKSCQDIRYLNLWVFMIDCDNIWGFFFHFLKICILGPKQGLIRGDKVPKRANFKNFKKIGL